MITTKDAGQLSIQVDACADLLPRLMLETRRQSNDAIKRGDLDAADQLDEDSAELALLYQTVLRHQIKEIDDTDELRDAIVKLTGINKAIDGIISGNESAAKFLETLASILGGFNGIAGKVFG